MQKEGNVHKMRSAVEKGEVSYFLPLGKEEVSMNDLIGKEIKLNYTGQINCIKCGRATKKSFAQGFCYPCFTTAPETEACVLKPELCQAHEGIARDMEYAEKHCLSDQFVYLSLTSGLKVGVTRHTQIPTRWIDQGAVRAIKLARTPNRYLAGKIEVELKAHLADKTNWRHMLTNQINWDIDLLEEKKRIAALLSAGLAQYLDGDDEIFEAKYPVSEYPQKVKSLNLDKTPEISGTLTGLKGQYIFLNGNEVMNIRKYGGYYLQMDY